MSLFGHRRFQSTARASVAVVLLCAGAAFASPSLLAQSAFVTHVPPETAAAGEALAIRVNVTNIKKFKRARLRYRVAGEDAFQKADFKPQGNRKRLVATIPGDAVTTAGVEYLVVVQSKRGKVTTPFGTAKSPVSVKVFVPAKAGSDTPTEKQAGEASTTETAESGTTTQAPPSENQAPTENGDDKTANETKRPAANASSPAAPEGTASDADDSGPSEDNDAGQGAASTDETSSGAAAKGSGPKTPAPEPASVAVKAPSSAVGARVIYGAGGPEATALEEELAVFAAEAPEAFYRDEIVAEERPIVFPQVLTRREIENLPVRTLADILKLFAGVETHLGIDGSDRLTVRGVRDLPRMVLLIDGVRVENPVDGGAYLFMPVTLIEEVRMHTRPGLDAAGPGGRLARIEVFTHKRDGLFAEAYGNSFIGGGAGVAGGWSFESVRIHGGAHVQGDLGPKETLDEDRYTDTAFERPPEEMLTAGQNVRGGATARAEVDVGPATLHAAAVTLAEWRGPYVGVFDTLGEDSRLIGTQSHVTAGAKAGLLGFMELSVDAYMLHTLREQNWQLTPKSFSTPDRDGDGIIEPFPDGVTLRRSYNAFTLGTQARAVIRAFTGNVLVAETEGRFGLVPPGGYLLESNRDINGRPQSLGTVEQLPVAQAGPCSTVVGTELGFLGACRGTFAGSIADAQTIMGMFRVGGGLRLVGYSDVGFDFLSNIQPHVGAEVLLFDQWALYGTFQTGNRAPTLEQRFDQSALTYLDVSRGAFVGNPDLGVESFRMIELGSKGAADVSGATLQASGAFFAMQNGSAIENIPVNGIVETVQNAGDLYVTGLEGSLKARFNGALPGDAGGSFAFANVSWFRGAFSAPPDLDQEADNCALLPGFGLPLDPGDAEPCSLVTDVPQLRANLGVLWDAGVFGTASATVSLGSERRNNARSTLERLRSFSIPGYALMNVSYRSAALFDVVGVFAEGYNILDTDPKDDVPRPDRMVQQLPRAGVNVLGGVYLKL